MSGGARKKSILTNIKNKNVKSNIVTKSDSEICSYKFQDEEKKESMVLDVDKFSSNELNDSVKRVKINPVGPFKFLESIVDESKNNFDEKKTPKQTDIDIKLETLSRRIQLNKSILERAYKQVKDIDYIMEKNSSPAKKYSMGEKSSVKDSDDQLLSPTDEREQAIHSTIEETLARMKKLVETRDNNPPHL